MVFHIQVSWRENLRCFVFLCLTTTKTFFSYLAPLFSQQIKVPLVLGKIIFFLFNVCNDHVTFNKIQTFSFCCLKHHYFIDKRRNVRGTEQSITLSWWPTFFNCLITYGLFCHSHSRIFKRNLCCFVFCTFGSFVCLFYLLCSLLVCLSICAIIACILGLIWSEISVCVCV